MCNSNPPGLPRAAVWLLLAGIRLSLAAEIPAMPPAPDSLLVGDLLRIDAQRARAAELAKTAGLAPMGAPGTGFPQISASPAFPSGDVSHPGIPGLTAVSPEPEAPAVSLTAIYGVGTRLHADIKIQGQLVTYAAGRAQPIRASDPYTVYRLRAIRPPCVQLDHTPKREPHPSGRDRARSSSSGAEGSPESWRRNSAPAGGGVLQPGRGDPVLELCLGARP